MIRSGLVPANKGLSVLDANGVTWHAMTGYPKRRNVAYNGLPNKQGTTSVLSTNQVVNPSFEGAVSPWSAINCTIALTTAFSQMLKSGTSILQATSDGTAVIPSVWMSSATYRPLVSPGQWVGFTSFLATEIGYQVAVQIQFRDAAGANLGYFASSWVTGSFYTGANPQVVAQAPANTVSVAYSLLFRNPADVVNPMASGKRLWADAAKLFIGGEQAEVQMRLDSAYYDGSTAADDFTYAWTGTAHLSTSTKTATAPAGWLYFNGTGETGVSYYRAIAGSDARTGVARREIWTPKSSGSTGWQYTEYISGVSGDTYTAQMLLNCPTSLSSKLRISFYNASTLVNSIDSSTQALVAGVPTNTVVTGAATGAFTNIRIWYYHTTGNTPGNGFYDASRCIIEPGTVQDSWFDGASPADINYIYSWEGAAFGSASVAMP